MFQNISFSCQVLNILSNGLHRKRWTALTHLFKHYASGHKYGLAIAMLGRACHIKAVSILCYNWRLYDATMRPHGISENNALPLRVFRPPPEEGCILGWGNPRKKRKGRNALRHVPDCPVFERSRFLISKCGRTLPHITIWWI